MPQVLRGRMSQDDISESVEGEEPLPRAHAREGISFGVAVVLFALGVLCGVPVALFGLEFFIDNAVIIFGLLFGLLVLAALVTALIVAFRRPILRTVVKRSELEMARFARPLAMVARHAAQQNVQEATDAAQELGELMLARYAWVSTRRWLVATITAFVAAIAALAGSALLFQQNQLLRGQSVLLAQQTDRLGEQNGLLAQQIQLGEAQRSTSIVPEILDIGAEIGAEVNALAEDGRPTKVFFDEELSAALSARIIAATNAARPYRYLGMDLARASNETLTAMAVGRRQDLQLAQEGVARFTANEEEMGLLVEEGQLLDRPVSPERGQILSLLFNLRVLKTEWLTLNGADFSFAELRMPTFGNVSMKHANLRFADLSQVQVRYGIFGAAYLDQARFRRAVVANTEFSSIASADIELPHTPDPSIDVWSTQLAGADFTGATISDTRFRQVQGLGMNFDHALLSNCDFTQASLAASTFRNAIIGQAVFDDADLSSVDFDGAIVFDPDFLGQLEVRAREGTFVRERFSITPIDVAELSSHPNAIQLWLIPGADEGRITPYLVSRVQGFEPQDDNAALPE